MGLLVKKWVTRQEDKYRDPSPFGYAQGQDDDFVGLDVLTRWLC